MANCCINCFDDPFVKDLVKQEGRLGDCDYCQSKPISILDTRRVGDFIRQGLERAYQRFDNPDNYHDGDYFVCEQPETALNLLDDMELLADEITDYESRMQLLSNLLNDSGPTHEDIKDGDEDWLENGDAELVLRYDIADPDRNKYTAAWETFKHQLRHHARFFDIHGLQTRDELLQPVSELFDQLTLTLPANTPLYRARIINDNRQLTQPCDWELEMGPPPFEKARQGRMNPRGISYFYLSNNDSACIAEIKPSVGEKVWLACFQTKQELKILDFTKIPQISITSIFSPDYDHHLRWLRCFLESFTQEISKPISEQDADTEYLTTQVFAEFIRNKGYQGIKYESSQHKGGINYTLFCDKKQACFDDYAFESRPVFTDWLSIGKENIKTCEITSLHFEKIDKTHSVSQK